MNTYDFAVIGGGMAGASAACELAEHGSVALIERETQHGYHSTGRSAATFIDGYGSSIWRALARVSRTFMEVPPAGFIDTPLLTPRGNLCLAKSADTDRLATTCAELNAANFPALHVDEKQIRDLCPALRPGMWPTGYYEEDAADIDVDALLQAYLRGFRAKSGSVFTGSAVTKIARNADWQVTFGDTTIKCDTIVNAAGAWADEIATIAGLPRRGLQPKRRSAITITTSEQFPESDSWPMTEDIAETFYFRPLSAGQIMASPVNEDDTPACDAQPDELDIAIIADRIQTVTSITVPRIEHSWAGLRTFAPDRQPVIGPDPEDEKFVWLAGQGGTGIVGAPAAAQLITAIARGAPVPDSLASIPLTDISPARLDPIT